MIAKSNLLIFDKVDINGNLFPKNCRVDIPEIIPIAMFNNHGPFIGSAEVTREETRLVATIYFDKSNKKYEEIKESIQDGDVYIGGYYKVYGQYPGYKNENGSPVYDDLKLLGAFLTFDDVYGDGSLRLELVDD